MDDTTPDYSGSTTQAVAERGQEVLALRWVSGADAAQALAQPEGPGIFLKRFPPEK